VDTRTLAQYPKEVTREQIAALPIGRYEGEVVLVDSPALLARAAADLAAERVIGWDIETRPAFRKGESYPPSLVQMATARAAYLFQLRFQLRGLDFYGALQAVFGAEKSIKAGISVKDDLKALKTLFPIEERSVVDAGQIAKRAGLEQTGMRNLAGIFLGFRIPKGTKTTNWSVQKLSSQQIAYAAMDAWACRELYLKFESLGIT
jgi:ribonuclease D